MSEIATGLSLAAAISLLLIWGIVFWFVCPWIGMTERATLIVRALIVVITASYILHDIVATYPASSAPYRPLDSPAPPSIMAPERR